MEGRGLCLKDTHSLLSVDRPPEVYGKPTGNPQNIAQHTPGQNAHKILWPSTHSAHKGAHLTACVGGATPPPHSHTHITPS